MFLRKIERKARTLRGFSIFSQPSIEAALSEETLKFRLPFKEKTIRVEINENNTLGDLREHLHE